MGAWGCNAFENDTAADWLAGLTQSNLGAVTEDALHAALPSPLALLRREAGEAPEMVLDADAACTALVAAEVVAAWGGMPHPAAPNNVLQLLAGQKAAYDAGLAELAQMAVDRVGEASELRDLWEESDDFEAWQEALRDLRARLNSPSARKPRS